MRKAFILITLVAICGLAHGRQNVKRTTMSQQGVVSISLGNADGFGVSVIQPVVAEESAPVVDVGTPVAWWKMTATGTNATQILDFANSYNASNMPSVASGAVLNTDGTNYYYTFNSLNYFNASPTNAFDIFTNQTFSASAWFDKNEASPDNPSVLLAKNSVASPFEGWIIDSSSDEKLSFLILGTGGGVNFNEIETVATFSGWHHVVAVYKGGLSPSNMEIWVDGTIQAVTTNSSTLTASANNGIPLQIGSRGGGADVSAWTGDIDDVRIFTNDLSETQIDNLFTEGRK